jgi:hypothetical protein
MILNTTTLNLDYSGYSLKYLKVTISSLQGSTLGIIISYQLGVPFFRELKLGFMLLSHLEKEPMQSKPF